MSLVELAVKAVKLAEIKGADEAEAYISAGRSVSIVFEKLNVKYANQSYDAGIGVRVVKNKRVGFAYATKLDMQSVEAAIDKALRIASRKPEDKSWVSMTEPKPLPKVKGLYDPEIESLDADDTMKISMELIDNAKVDKRIVAGSGGAGYGFSEYTIANSHGVEASEKGSFIYASIYLISAQNGETGMGYDFEASRSLKEFDHVKLAREAAEMALSQLGKKPIETREMEVILHPFAVSSILEGILIPELSGDNVYKGKTPFARLKGEAIASKKLTIIDDGTLTGGYSSSPFDGEGHPTMKKPLIENGILKNYLYDTYWANKAGEESTGNARRNYNSEPSIGPTNLIVEPGMKSFQELVSEIENGIYVISLMGVHTANISSGEFSVVASPAYTIKNGEIESPVKQAMIAGNMKDLIRKVDEVGREVKKVGNILTPHLRIKGVKVSG